MISLAYKQIIYTYYIHFLVISRLHLFFCHATSYVSVYQSVICGNIRKGSVVSVEFESVHGDLLKIPICQLYLYMQVAIYIDIDIELVLKEAFTTLLLNSKFISFKVENEIEMFSL